MVIGGRKTGPEKAGQDKGDAGGAEKSAEIAPGAFRWKY